MKKLVIIPSILVLATLVIAPVSAQAPTPTVTLLNPPPDGIVNLAVGESCTFEVEIASDEPFLLAQAAFSQYYPGRSVFADNMVTAHRTNHAVLSITVTGKAPTASLPDGIAPASLVVGVRYPGGVVYPVTYEVGIIVH